MKNRFAVFSFALLTLSGCATQPNSVSNDPFTANLVEEDLYLRGTFNWWGAQQAYRFIPSTGETWTVEIDLIDDGVAYDFKLSDANWTPSQTCGSPSDSGNIALGASLTLACSPNYPNLQIAPNGNGRYRFTLSQSANSTYTLSVVKL